MSSPQPLSRFHGAVLVRLSPDLLYWLTRYSPKRGHKRKLNYLEENGEPFFEESELKDFDTYLNEPWPCEDGERPNIPVGIEREIEVEAFYSCAICGKSTRESAHIDPVHSTKNNHPHNLICLCPTHHTEYDAGIIKKVEITAKKKALIAARLTLWKLQARGIDCALSAIAEVGEPNELPEGIKVLLKAETLEALGKAAAEAPDGEFKREIAAAVTQEDAISSLNDARNHELERLGEVDCPLCEGSGTHNGFDCPVCDGFGAVDEKIADMIDLQPYELVTCPLCEGSRDHNGYDCPVCDAQGEVDRGLADQVDLSVYVLVECPLCNGSRRHNGDDCPVCDAQGEVDRGLADQVDLSAYDLVECPLCNGSRRHNGDDCSVCDAQGEVDRGLADQVDPSDYQ